MGGEVARLLTEALEGRLSPDLVLQLVLLKIPMAMEILLEVMLDILKKPFGCTT
jgi:lipopolysaccharide export LptBFGC system permease protein LptF